MVVLGHVSSGFGAHDDIKSNSPLERCLDTIHQSEEVVSVGKLN